MDAGIYLNKLVKLSIRKRTPPKAFLKLFKQLLEKENVLDNEILESLIELNSLPRLDQAPKSLQFSYAIQFACSGGSENARFMKLLSKTSVETQRKYILYFKNNFKRLLPENLMREFINEGFLEYSKELSQNFRQKELNQLLRNVWTYTLFLWGSIIEHHSDLIAISAFKELGIHIMTTLKTSEDPDMMNYFSSKANLILNTSELYKDAHTPIVHAKSKTETPSFASIKKSLALNMSSKRVQHYVMLKRFIWLNTRFRSWDINQLVERYFQFFKILMQKVEDVIEEIVRAFFGGIIIAIKLQEDAFVIFNWKNYIVTKLPQVLKELKVVHNQGISENVEEMLLQKLEAYKDEAITKMTAGGLEDQPYDLRKQFTLSCVYRQVVTLESMLKLFPKEGENLSQALITHQIEQLTHVDSLNSDIHSRLLDINAELTSLEESKLIEGFKSLASSNMFFLEPKQRRLYELMHKCVDTLTREKNIEKLARLVLALSSALPAANYVFFHDEKGPFGLLDKVIAFIDGESFSVDADDSNFQEVYAQFGVLMSGVILLLSTFGIEFDQVYVESSYTIEYINRFFYQLGQDLTDVFEGENDQDKTIVHNYNRLMGDWINALFDVNNDGLSDDLIKSVNVKQIYKLMLVMFQLAINAKLVGALSSASLDNGIDYLSQNFLAPCAMAIMYWAATKIGPMQPASEAAADVLLRIIRSGGAEPSFGFRVVLNTVGRHILARVCSVGEWRGTEKLAQLAHTVEATLDREYCGARAPNANAPEFAGADSAVESVRRAVVHYLAGADAVECWRQVRHWWPAVSSAELRETLLQDLERGTRATGAPGTTEEARVFAQFLVFMIVNSGAEAREGFGVGADDGAAPTDTAAVAASPASLQYGFTVTVDNHYASIFNTVSAQEAKAPKDADITDLDMDDLFNDVGDDLFGDMMAQTMPPLDSPPVCRTPATGGVCYRQVRRFVGLTLAVAALRAEPGDSAAVTHLAAMARLLVAAEIDHWVHLSKSH